MAAETGERESGKALRGARSGRREPIHWASLEVAAYFGELGVDLGGEAIEAGYRNQRQQSSDESVLNEILTGFILQEVFQ